MDKNLETFLQKWYTNAQWFYGKMLNVINYYRNVNQNHKDKKKKPQRHTTSHLPGLHRKERIARIGKDVAKCIHCYWDSPVAQPLWKTIWQLFKTSNIGVSHDPTLPLLGIYPKEMKVLGHMYIHFHSDMIHNSLKVETMQMSINGRMDKHIKAHT